MWKQKKRQNASFQRIQVDTLRLGCIENCMMCVCSFVRFLFANALGFFALHALTRMKKRRLRRRGKEERKNSRVDAKRMRKNCALHLHATLEYNLQSNSSPERSCSSVLFCCSSIPTHTHTLTHTHTHTHTDSRSSLFLSFALTLSDLLLSSCLNCANRNLQS